LNAAADTSGQSETAVETPAPVRPSAGGGGGGGCFIDSTTRNTSAILHLTILISLGLIISIAAGMKKHRI
jgi:hypothetical protein